MYLSISDCFNRHAFHASFTKFPVRPKPLVGAPAAWLVTLRLLWSFHFLSYASKHQELSFSSVRVPFIFWGPVIAFSCDPQLQWKSSSIMQFYNTGLIFWTREVIKLILFWQTSYEGHLQYKRHCIFLEKGNVFKYWPREGELS